MARIKTYTLDSQIDPADKVIGSDGQVGVNFGKTKNYTMSALAEYFAGGTGAAGASAYDIWISEGNTGTIQDFLDSLVGAAGSQGSTGPAGANGTNGVQGAPGADGTSITIQGTQPTVGDLPVSGSLGDLWIIDQTGGGATAGDGYVWTAESTWLNIGPLRGPQGIQGVAGANGAAGAQGPQGIQGTQGIQGIQGTAGSDGSEFVEVTGITPKIADASGNVTGDYAALDYSVQEVRMHETQISGAFAKLYTFSVYLAVNANLASENFFKDNNAITIKLDGFTDAFSRTFNGHSVNAIVEFEDINDSTAQKQGITHAVLVGGEDYIRLVTSQYNFNLGTVTHPGELTTALVRSDTSFFTVRINGMFRGL
jgi:hypothetical protein